MLLCCPSRVFHFHKTRLDPLEEVSSRSSTAALFGSPKKASSPSNLQTDEPPHTKIPIDSTESTSPTTNNPFADWNLKQKIEQESDSVDAVAKSALGQDNDWFRNALRRLGRKYRDLEEECTTQRQELEAQSLAVQGYTKELRDMEEKMRASMVDIQYLGVINAQLNSELHRSIGETSIDLCRHPRSFQRLEEKFCILQEKFSALQQAGQAQHGISSSAPNYAVRPSTREQRRTTPRTHQSVWQNARTTFRSAIIERMGEFCQERLGQLALQCVQRAFETLSHRKDVSRKKPHADVASSSSQSFEMLSHCTHLSHKKPPANTTSFSSH